jgi:hypothetical protein
VTYGQAGAVCPKCGSAAAVHSIEEWAAMAQANMGNRWQPSAPMPGYPAQPGPPPGYGPAPEPGSAPQPGFPDPSQYQQSGFPDPSRYQQPGSPDTAQQPPSPPSPAEPQPAPQPGYQAGPQPGYPSEPWQNQPPPRRSGNWDIGSDASTLEEAIGGAVLGAATKAIGRMIGRKVRQTYNERVAPALAAQQQAMLGERMAIAQRHPDLRACLNDQVVFLVGGTRTLPLASAMRVRTVEQSDALVAELRG